jgi:acyl-CoA thioesterase-1
VLTVASLAARADSPTILVFGDSISAGYGLAHADEGWVGALQTTLKGLGYGYQVVNASVSGETTAGGLERLPRALALHHPAIVILELGGNDGLRALPLPEMRDNLAQMIDLCRRADAKVLLLGIRIPPNYGPQYAEQFAAVYGELARRDHLDWVPFLLDGVALHPDLMQADGIHPNERGQPILLEHVLDALKPLLAHGSGRPR